MKRSELRRHTELRNFEKLSKRKGGVWKHDGVRLKGSKLSPVNAKRKAKLTLRNFGPPEFRTFVKSQPCQYCGEAPKQWWNRKYWGSDMAHVEGRKMGGCGGDYTTVTSACPPCHDAGRPDGQYAKANETQKRWKASDYYRQYLRRMERKPAV